MLRHSSRALELAKVAARLGYESFKKNTDSFLIFLEIFSWVIKLFHVFGKFESTLALVIKNT